MSFKLDKVLYLFIEALNVLYWAQGSGEERVQYLQLSVGSIPCTQAICACVSNLVIFNLIPGVLA